MFLFAIPLHSSASALLTRYNSFSLPLLIQDLEEELELDRRRVSEAEGVAKRAEEELAVAKERLLLQEDELQSRAGSPSVASPVGRRNAHVGGNQLSSVHFHSDSALIKFSPHAIIIYTRKCNIIHPPRKANSFIKVSSYPVSRNASNFIYCTRTIFVSGASSLTVGLL